MSSVDLTDPNQTATHRRRTCKFCAKVCSSSSALLYHTRLHTGERPYVCRVCNKGFIQKVHLQRHLENNHGGVTDPSDFVPRNSAPTMVRPVTNIGNRLEAVATQLKISKGAAEPIKCSYCDERYMGQVALMEHVVQNHQHGRKHSADSVNNSDYGSGAGSLAGDTNNQMDTSQLSDHNVFLNGTSPSATLKTGTRAEPVSCQQCDQVFMGQIAYLEHLYEVHGDHSEDPQEIPVETELNARNQHQLSPSLDGAPTSNSKKNSLPPRRNVTSVNTWCVLCNKHLSSPTSLMVHMRAHSGVRPFTCPQDKCGKTFMHQNSLKIHMMSHSGQRPHSCKICGKSFTTTRTLKIHTMIHTGERPYGCKFCGRRFIQQIHLLRHIKSHIRKGPNTEGAPEGNFVQKTATSPTNASNRRPLKQFSVIETPSSRSHHSAIQSLKSEGREISESGVSSPLSNGEGSGGWRPGAIVKMEKELMVVDTNSSNNSGQWSPPSDHSTSGSLAGDATTVPSLPDTHTAIVTPVIAPNTNIATVSASAQSTLTTLASSTASVSPYHRQQHQQGVQSGDRARARNNSPNECLNCELFESELSHLRAEIGQLKQFLAAKFTLMETKILGMQRCLTSSTSHQ